MRGNKNLRKLLDKCKELIANYESANYPSCSSDLLDAINPVLKSSVEEASNWNETTDYELLAIKLLVNLSFDLLASGRYNIYRGTLDPLSSGRNLLRVYESAMFYCYDHDLITQDQLKEQFDYLNECISNVG